MPRDPIPTWFIVLVAVHLGHRWLLVQEAKHGNLWYLPAGRVEPGEALVAAAKRETLEEMAGLPLRGEEVLRLFTYLSERPVIASLTTLTDEGAPFR